MTNDQCCKKIGHTGPGHIHETAPPDCSACVEGACWDPNSGDCAITDAAGCTNTFLGIQTNCNDSDGDGLPDIVETNDCCTGFTDLLNTGTNPFEADSDGDGVDDRTEILNGTDPCLPEIVIPPGEDCWNTECGRTKFSFCDLPIPADFFNPGSEPFDAVVPLEGVAGIDTRVQPSSSLVSRAAARARPGAVGVRCIRALAVHT